MTKTILRSESDSVEFKNSFGAVVFKSLAVSANRCEGCVYIGVNNHKKVLDVSLSKKNDPQWINKIRFKTSPQRILDVGSANVKGKHVVVFSITKYLINPVSVMGWYLIRSDAANQTMPTSDVVEVRLRPLNSSWDYNLGNVHDLHSITLDKVQQTILQAGPNSRDIVELPLDYLRKRVLLCEDRITNASYLMFVGDKSPMTTKLGRYQTDTTFKVSQCSKSDIISQITNVLDFAEKHINKQILKTNIARHEERREYPLEAIQKLKMNMIVHRDYRTQTYSVVIVFPVRIMFYSPVRLPGLLTMVELRSNQYVFQPHNQMYVNIFKNRGDIEKYGSKPRRIPEQFRKYDSQPPVFLNVSDGFWIVLYKTTSDVGENDVSPMIDTFDNKVLAYLAQNESSTVSDISYNLKRFRSPCGKNLCKAQSDGVVRSRRPRQRGNVLENNQGRMVSAPEKLRLSSCNRYKIIVLY